MKICILTQPLHTNYGGLLQAYALQTVLKRMGHEVLTEDRKYSRSFIDRLKSINAIRVLFGKERIITISDKDKKIMSRCTDEFIRKYISTTPPVYSCDKRELRNFHFDAFLVGSDQVWRPMYSPCLQNYFLDFTEGQKVKRVAYAASFGTDEWEFTPEQTAACSELAKQFDAISVREESGIGLCKNYFGVDAAHLLDPTMLLEKDDYISLVTQEQEPEHTGKVLTYFLDRTAMKDSVADAVCDKLNGTSFSVMPEKQYSEVGSKELSRCVYPSVTSWLRGFMDAEYVVTDSFHGTVFSIIFNKPFIAIANRERGLSRFSSLLNKFGLEDRLVFSSDDLTEELLKAKIDFDKVNSIRKSEQVRAFEFLEISLK